MYNHALKQREDLSEVLAQKKDSMYMYLKANLQVCQDMLNQKNTWVEY